MNESARCPKCGIGLPADAPAGLCPKCLVQAGLESEPVAQTATQPTAESPPSFGFVPPSVEELASRFPQLEILELVGRGGMGAVYKARQPGLDRIVAVKILPPEVGRDPSFAERFTREARALARLSHPSIVTVHDFGRVGELYYFVMEFIDGTNLRQAMRAGQLQPQQALAIVPQICDALQYAHDEGVVHRDIKPENILLDKRGRVKIADFGLSKLVVGSGATPDMTLTGTHQVMGTMRYMAPEQMEGAKAVDHRADIYSLGVVFYEMLTGELPLGRFAPPSQKVQVDVRLDEVVLRSLEKEPQRRYQQASQLKTDVESLRSGEVLALASGKADGPPGAPHEMIATYEQQAWNVCDRFLTPDRREHIIASLAEDERLIWADKIGIAGTFRFAMRLGLTLFLIAAGFLVGSGMHRGVLRTGWDTAYYGFLVAGVTLGAAALIALVRRGRTFYTLTDRRAIVWVFSGWGNVNAQRYGPTQLAAAECIERRDGSGSLIFEKASSYYLTTRGFKDINDVRHVRELIGEIVLRSLEKEPQRRYQQASEVTGGPNRSDAEIETARDRLIGPAVGLQLASGLNILLAALLLVAAIGIFAWEGWSFPPARDEAEMLVAINVIQLLVLPFAVTIYLGARRMRHLESFGLSMAAGYLAVFLGGLALLLFLISLGSSLGAWAWVWLPSGLPSLIALPIGIWALVVLNRPEVRAAFRAGEFLSTPRKAERPARRKWAMLAVICLALLCLMPPGALLMWKLLPLSGSQRLPMVQERTWEHWSGNKGHEIMRFWGLDVPTVSDRLSRHLDLDPPQRATMNQAFATFFREFRALEVQNTQSETDENGRQITTIAPFRDQHARLQERFWSELESALDGRQLTLGRKTVNLSGGMFELAEFGYRVEIWRVGRINPWYHWRESFPGISTISENDQPSSGPQLPEKLRRFWKEPDAATVGENRWEEEFGAEIRVPIARPTPTHVAYSTDGKKLIALIGEDLHVWEHVWEHDGALTSRGRRPILNILPGARYSSLAPGGESITLVREGGTVELWNLADGQRIAQVNAGTAHCAEFSPDRQLAAVAGENATVKLWDVKASSQRKRLDVTSAVTAVTFSTDGALLAGACKDGTVKIWEVASSEPLATFNGLSAEAICVAFAPDGQRLAAGTKEGIVAIWQVATGKLEATLKGESGLSSIAFSPRGWHLVLGNLNGTVQRWLRFSAIEDAPLPLGPGRVHALQVGHIPDGGDELFLSLAVQGKYAYLILGNAVKLKRLHVVDISDPPRPQFLGTCPLTPYAMHLAVFGNHVYVLDEPKLRVFDVSRPEEPREIGSCELGGSLWDLAIQDRYAYVTDVSSVRVIDVGDPSAPKQVGRCELEEAQGITVAGQHAYVACNIEGVHILDISDPTMPKKVGVFDGPQGAADVVVAGNYAYVAGGEDAVTLWIADISDPRGPKSVGRYGDWIVGSVTVEGDHAFLEGDIVDVSEPAAPQRVGGFSGGECVVVGDYLYTISDEGLSILRVIRNARQGSQTK